jgi:AcrR family transcriptional regulator
VRRAQESAATQEAILAAAMRLFLEHGYGKVTVNDIAHAAEIAVPTVYASTGGKSAILGATLEQAMGDPIAAETLAAAGQSSSPRDVLRVTAQGVRSDTERYHEVIRVMEAAAAILNPDVLPEGRV